MRLDQSKLVLFYKITKERSHILKKLYWDTRKWILKANLNLISETPWKNIPNSWAAVSDLYTAICYSFSMEASSRQKRRALKIFTSMLAPRSSKSIARSTCPPQAASVKGDSKLSAGMLTCAPESSKSLATSTCPSIEASIKAVCISSVLCSWSAPASSKKRTISRWPL